MGTIDKNQLEAFVETPDYLAISRNFSEELSHASRGESSSLPFVKNPLPERSLVQPHDFIQAFVIGGTNGSVATAQLEDDKKVSISEQKAFSPLPIFATIDDFLAFIEDNLAPKTTAIGVNFAYNLTPVAGEHGTLDGITNQKDIKGHAFEGLQQKQVGKVIQDHLKTKLDRDILISVANDTVCLITSGLKKDTNRDTLIAAIAGTGYNLAMFFNHNTVVNLEAADFAGFMQTTTGKMVDAQSKNPGEQLYNKEVAAGDLYKHYNVLLPQLNLQSPPLQSSEELSALAKGEKIGSEIARRLIDRSARLVAAHFAGMYDFKGKPERISCIIQGSLFTKEAIYLQTIQEQLQQLGVPKDTIQFEEVANSDTIGAFKLLTG